MMAPFQQQQYGAVSGRGCHCAQRFVRRVTASERFEPNVSNHNPAKPRRLCCTCNLVFDVSYALRATGICLQKA